MATLKKRTQTYNLLLHDLLACPPETIGRPIGGFKSWSRIWKEAGHRWQRPIERSIFTGLQCDRLAWTFASGYQGAIRSLYPDLPEGFIAAICISEAGGNHPRSIQARLTPTGEDYRLDGEKHFITGGKNADRLMVAVSIGMHNSRNRIRMLWVDRNAPGVDLEPMPPLPFIPEIAHCSARFQDVPIPREQVLPGDGYANAVKPFRTIEDLHVTGAVLGHLLGVARRYGWPDGILPQISLLITATIALTSKDPLSPDTHLAMGALFEQLDALLATMEPLWPETDPCIARRWQRDKPVLKIAGKNRWLRLEAARRHFGI